MTEDFIGILIGVVIWILIIFFQIRTAIKISKKRSIRAMILCFFYGTQVYMIGKPLQFAFENQKTYLIVIYILFLVFTLLTFITVLTWDLLLKQYLKRKQRARQYQS